MKRKILIFVLALLSVLCLTSCDGEKEPEKEYFQVNFYGEGGRELGSVGELILGENNEIPKDTLGKYINKVYKTGYTFLGFANKDGMKYFDGEGNRIGTIIIDKTVDLYPVYEPYSCTISFDAQAGMLDTGAEKTISLKYGDDLTGKFPKATSSNPKFEFDGWFNQDGSVRYSNGTEPVQKEFASNVYPIDSNGATITMYAKFKVREITVTLDFCDGVTLAQEIKVEYGKPIGSLSRYYKDTGTQDIVGWSSLSYSEAPLPDVVTEDIRIYAVWKDYKNVVFVYGADDEKTEKIYQTPGQSTKLPEGEKLGYNFGGWYATPSLSGNPIANVPYGALADKYYSKWSAINYNLTFNTGTDEVIGKVTYQYKNTIELPTPKREGYTFGGWYCDGEKGTFTKTPATMYGDKELQAKWISNNYSASLDADGGTLKANSGKVAFGENFTLEVPEKYGYTFLGWYKGDTAYTDGNGKSLDVFKELNDIELTAKYEINVYKVIFMVNGVELDKKDYVHGTPLVFTDKPVDEKLFFFGWYDSGFTTEYKENADVVENMTLHAKVEESIPISSAADLNKIRDNPGANYHLTKDINLTAESWVPIAELTGAIDGRGHKIFNFSISATSGASGFVAVNKGLIQNLTLSDFTVNANLGNDTYKTGCITGENYGRIINCHTKKGEVKINVHIYPVNPVASTVIFGGIAGLSQNNSTIDSCTSDVKITSSTYQEFYKDVFRPTSMVWCALGGITGTAGDSVIKNCVYTGEIVTSLGMSGQISESKPEHRFHIGGIAGVGNASIENCYVNSTISANASDARTKWNNLTSNTTIFYTGGIIGALQSGGTISNCISEGIYSVSNKRGNYDVYEKIIMLGGIAGEVANGATVSDCYSNANVTRITARNGDTGGLVGGNSGKIKNSYSTGNVTAAGGSAGGFVGANYSAGTISNCFSLGNVTFTESGNKGIFIGYVVGTSRGCAVASEAVLTIGGSVATSGAVSGVTVMPKADILKADFIYNTLYWEDEIWTAKDGRVPVLFYNDRFCQAYFYDESDSELGFVNHLLPGESNKIPASKINAYISANQKDGYTLLGFADKEGNMYFDGQGTQLDTAVIDKTVHLYPVYEAYNYTLSFDAQDGALLAGTSNEIQVKYDDDLTGKFPNAVHPELKYEFDGWFNEDGSVRYSNGTEPVNAKLTSEHYTLGENGSTITMYAKFKVKEFTLTIDFCDGETPAVEIKLEYGSAVGDLSAYYKDSGTKDIACWSTSLDAEAPIPEVITENTKIYAIWKEYKNVTFVGNGTEIVKKIHYTAGESTELPVDVFHGYTVVGWYLDSELSGDAACSIPYGELADKYYAKLELTGYSVSFDTGSDDVIDPIVYCHGDTVKLPKPKKEDHIFLGWQLEGSEELYFEISADMEGDKVFTAKWQESTPISSAEDLEKIRENPSGTFHLKNDIDLKFENWSPISSFSGILDGNGYKISNLVMNGNQVTDLAFIIENTGTIQNLSFDNVSFSQTSTSKDTWGAILVSYNSGKIINCHLLSGKMKFDKVAVDGNEGGWSGLMVGTVAAGNWGLISGCTTYVDIEATVGIKSHMAGTSIGGLVGIAYGTIENCYAELTIKAIATNTNSYNQFHIGGMISQNYSGDLYCRGNVANCNIIVDKGSATGGVFANCGGFMGANVAGTITECYSKGTIYVNCNSNGDSRFVPHVGGFIGGGQYNDGMKINNCYSETEVTVTGMASQVGAFAGYAAGEITNCAAYGTVSNASGATGTFAGYISSTGTVKCCLTTLTGAFDGGCDGSKINNANANDHTLDELKSTALLCDKLYFDNEIWVIDGKELPTLAWQNANG